MNRQERNKKKAGRLRVQVCSADEKISVVMVSLGSCLLVKVTGWGGVGNSVKIASRPMGSR